MTQNRFAQLTDHAPSRRIIDILRETGHETRFVGGCVRDVLMERRVGDIDMATTAPPEDVMAVLQRHRITVVPTGLAHGTVTAVIDDQPFEITTLRKDVATDGRHAEIAYTHDWAEDALRRDFTINAMSVDLDGTLYDYYGGVEDIHSKTLRFVGDTATRIREDYLRLLRFFRFASVFNWRMHDRDALDICRDLAPELRRLSRERVQSELLKLVSGDGCLMIAEQMFVYKIWQGLVPDITPALSRLTHVVQAENTIGIPDGFRRLLALLGWHDDAVLETVMVLTREQRKRLELLRRCAEHPDWKLEKALYFFGVTCVRDVAYLHERPVDEARIAQWQKPPFPVTAEMLMIEMNLSGPTLGATLKKAEMWWVDHDFAPTIDDIMAFCRVE